MSTPYGPPGSENPQWWGQQQPATRSNPATASGDSPPQDHQQGHGVQGSPPGYWPQGHHQYGYARQDYPPPGHGWQDYPPPGYPPPGYPPAGYPPPGGPVPGHPQQGFAQPAGYPQPGYPPPGHPQSGYPQSGYPHQGYPQQNYPHQSHGQQEYPQQGYQPYGPQQSGQQPYPEDYDQPDYGDQGEQSEKSALTWVLSGVGGVLLLGAILIFGFIAPGFFTTTVFDRNAVQGGVQRILSEDYGQNVESVSCPSDQEVRTGTTFTCQATIDGEPREVTITVRTEAGEYEVARPS